MTYIFLSLALFPGKWNVSIYFKGDNAKVCFRQWAPARSHTTQDPFTRKNVKLENEIRDNIYRMNAIIDIMHLEINILPVRPGVHRQRSTLKSLNLSQKPLKTYRHLIRTLQRAIDIMVGLRRVRDHIPRKETVQDVMPFRREVVRASIVY